MEGVDVHQTIYYPCSGDVYRATIEGNDLIIESLAPIGHKTLSRTLPERVLKSFSLFKIGREFMGEREQHRGKITSIGDNFRKHFIRQLTEESNVYSLGRYATWRNIGMDDILKDIFQIRKLMSADKYDRALSASK